MIVTYRWTLQGKSSSALSQYFLFLGSVFFHCDISVIFCWEISVICLTVASKLAVTANVFRHCDRNDLILFNHFKYVSFYDPTKADGGNCPVAPPSAGQSLQRCTREEVFGCFQKLMQLILSLTVHVMYIWNNVFEHYCGVICKINKQWQKRLYHAVTIVIVLSPLSLCCHHCHCVAQT